MVTNLLSRGYKVRVLDNFMYTSGGLAAHFINPDFEVIRGNVTDAGVVRDSLKGVDAVIHLAAIVGYPACKRDPEMATDVNFKATKQLGELAPKGIPIIFSSTSSVYGENDSGMCTEETPPNPLSLYGETKLNAENSLEKRGNTIVFRFATAFGMSPRMRLDLLVNDFVYQAIWNKYIVIYEQNYRRAFVHVKDIVSALVFGLENAEKMGGEVYNVGSEALNLTKGELARRIKEKVNFYMHFAEVGKDEDKRNFSLAYDKIRALGFEAQIGLDQGLDELVRGISTIRIATPFSNA